MEKCSGTELVNKFKELGVHLSARDEEAVKQMYNTGNKDVNKFLLNFVHFVNKEENTLTPEEEDLYEKAVASNTHKTFEDGSESLTTKNIHEVKKEINDLTTIRDQFQEDINHNKRLINIYEKLKVFQQHQIDSLKENCIELERQKDYADDSYKDLVETTELCHGRFYREVSLLYGAFKYSNHDNKWYISEKSFERYKETISRCKIEIHCIESQCLFSMDGFKMHPKCKELNVIQEKLANALNGKLVNKCLLAEVECPEVDINEDAEEIKKLIKEKLFLLEKYSKEIAKKIVEKEIYEIYKEQIVMEKQYLSKIDQYRNHLLYTLINFYALYNVELKKNNAISQLLSVLNNMEYYIHNTLDECQREIVNMQIVNNKVKKYRELPLEKRYVILSRINEILNETNEYSPNSLKEFDNEYKSVKIEVANEIMKGFNDVIQKMFVQINHFKAITCSNNISKPLVIPSRLIRIFKELEGMNAENYTKLMDMKVIWKRNKNASLNNPWLKVSKCFWAYYIKDYDGLHKILKELEEEVFQQENKKLLALRQFLNINVED